MGAPVFASHFKLWLLPWRVEQLQRSRESARDVNGLVRGRRGRNDEARAGGRCARRDPAERDAVLAHYGTSYAFFDEVDASVEVGCR